MTTGAAVRSGLSWALLIALAVAVWAAVGVLAVWYALLILMYIAD